MIHGYFDITSDSRLDPIIAEHSGIVGGAPAPARLEEIRQPSRHQHAERAQQRIDVVDELVSLHTCVSDSRKAY